jgi:excisionase family DNA binding protein
MPNQSHQQQPESYSILAGLLRSDLLNTEQAAAYLGVTMRTLEVWRCTKRHAIPYIKVGRLVKYRKTDLDAWLIEQTVGGCAG